MTNGFPFLGSGRQGRTADHYGHQPRIQICRQTYSVRRLGTVLLFRRMPILAAAYIRGAPDRFRQSDPTGVERSRMAHNKITIESKFAGKHSFEIGFPSHEIELRNIRAPKEILEPMIQQHLAD